MSNWADEVDEEERQVRHPPTEWVEGLDARRNRLNKDHGFFRDIKQKVHVPPPPEAAHKGRGSHHIDQRGWLHLGAEGHPQQADPTRTAWRMPQQPPAPPSASAAHPSAMPQQDASDYHGDYSTGDTSSSVLDVRAPVKILKRPASEGLAVSVGSFGSSTGGIHLSSSPTDSYTHADSSHAAGYRAPYSTLQEHYQQGSEPMQGRRQQAASSVHVQGQAQHAGQESRAQDFGARYGGAKGTEQTSYQQMGGTAGVAYPAHAGFAALPTQATSATADSFGQTRAATSQPQAHPQTHAVAPESQTQGKAQRQGAHSSTQSQSYSQAQTSHVMGAESHAPSRTQRAPSYDNTQTSGFPQGYSGHADSQSQGKPQRGQSYEIAAHTAGYPQGQGSGTDSHAQGKSQRGSLYEGAYHGRPPAASTDHAVAAALENLPHGRHVEAAQFTGHSQARGAHGAGPDSFTNTAPATYSSHSEPYNHGRHVLDSPAAPQPAKTSMAREHAVMGADTAGAGAGWPSTNRPGSAASSSSHGDSSLAQYLQAAASHQAGQGQGSTGLPHSRTSAAAATSAAPAQPQYAAGSAQQQQYSQQTAAQQQQYAAQYMQQYGQQYGQPAAPSQPYGQPAQPGGQQQYTQAGVQSYAQLSALQQQQAQPSAQQQQQHAHATSQPQPPMPPTSQQYGHGVAQPQQMQPTAQQQYGYAATPQPPPPPAASQQYAHAAVGQQQPAAAAAQQQYSQAAAQQHPVQAAVHQQHAQASTAQQQAQPQYAQAAVQPAGAAHQYAQPAAHQQYSQPAAQQPYAPAAVQQQYAQPAAMPAQQYAQATAQQQYAMQAAQAAQAAQQQYGQATSGQVPPPPPPPAGAAAAPTPAIGGATPPGGHPQQPSQSPGDMMQWYQHMQQQQQQQQQQMEQYRMYQMYQAAGQPYPHQQLAPATQAGSVLQAVQPAVAAAPAGLPHTLPGAAPGAPVDPMMHVQQMMQHNPMLVPLMQMFAGVVAQATGQAVVPPLVAGQPPPPPPPPAAQSPAAQAAEAAAASQVAPATAQDGKHGATPGSAKLRPGHKTYFAPHVRDKEEEPSPSQWQAPKVVDGAAAHAARSPANSADVAAPQQRAGQRAPLEAPREPPRDKGREARDFLRDTSRDPQHDAPPDRSRGKEAARETRQAGARDFPYDASHDANSRAGPARGQDADVPPWHPSSSVPQMERKGSRQSQDAGREPRRRADGPEPAPAREPRAPLEHPGRWQNGHDHEPRRHVALSHDEDGGRGAHARAPGASSSQQGLLISIRNDAHTTASDGPERSTTARGRRAQESDEPDSRSAPDGKAARSVREAGAKGLGQGLGASRAGPDAQAKPSHSGSRAAANEVDLDHPPGLPRMHKAGPAEAAQRSGEAARHSDARTGDAATSKGGKQAPGGTSSSSTASQPMDQKARGAAGARKPERTHAGEDEAEGPPPGLEGRGRPGKAARDGKASVFDRIAGGSPLQEAPGVSSAPPGLSVQAPKAKDEQRAARGGAETSKSGGARDVSRADPDAPPGMVRQAGDGPKGSRRSSRPGDADDVDHAEAAQVQSKKAGSGKHKGAGAGGPSLQAPDGPEAPPGLGRQPISEAAKQVLAADSAAKRAATGKGSKAATGPAEPDLAAPPGLSRQDGAQDTAASGASSARPAEETGAAKKGKGKGKGAKSGAQHHDEEEGGPVKPPGLTGPKRRTSNSGDHPAPAAGTSQHSHPDHAQEVEAPEGPGSQQQRERAKAPRAPRQLYMPPARQGPTSERTTSAAAQGSAAEASEGGEQEGGAEAEALVAASAALAYLPKTRTQGSKELQERDHSTAGVQQLVAGVRKEDFEESSEQLAAKMAASIIANVTRQQGSSGAPMSDGSEGSNGLTLQDAAGEHLPGSHQDKIEQPIQEHQAQTDSDSVIDAAVSSISGAMFARLLSQDVSGEARAQTQDPSASAQTEAAAAASDRPVEEAAHEEAAVTAVAPKGATQELGLDTATQQLVESMVDGMFARLSQQQATDEARPAAAPAVDAAEAVLPAADRGGRPASLAGTGTSASTGLAAHTSAGAPAVAPASQGMVARAMALFMGGNK